MKKEKGFSLIEFVMTTLILAIIAGVGASIMLYALQDLTYTPRKLKMDFLAQDALAKIVDGDQNAHGLRFSRNITVANPNNLTYTDQDGRTVAVSLNNVTNKLTRTINGSADSNFVYYAATGESNVVTGRNGALFLYYNATNATTATAANVRKIEINFIARTTGGNYSNWEGSSEQSTTVYVPKYQ